MRFLLVVFLTSWLIGTLLGVIQQPYSIMIIAATLLWAAVWYWHWRVQIRLAALILLVASYMYGLGSQPTIATGCAVPKNFQASILQRVISQKTVNYVVSSQTQPPCQILLRATRFPLFNLGDRISSRGGQVELVSRIKPEYAGYQKYLQRQGIVATVSFSHTELIQVNQRWQTRQYDRIRLLIQKAFREPTTSLVSAMLINDTGSLPDDITTSLQLTGTSHIISISGLHLSLVAGVLLTIFTALPVTRTQRTVLMIVILCTYVVFIGAPIAAVRSLIFWTVALVALRLGWLSSLMTMLMLTLTILISYNPQLWLDISFQLSCLAVAGILFTHFLSKPVIDRWSASSQPKAVLKGLLSALLVSLGATLTTWPLVAYYFGTVSFISLLANLIIVPLSTLVLITALLTLTLSVFSPSLGSLIAFTTHLSALAIFKIAGLLAAIPGSSLSNISLSLTVIYIYYLTLVFLSLWWLKHQQRSWREVWV